MVEIEVETDPNSIEIEFALTPAEQRESAELLRTAARRQLGLERRWQLVQWLPWTLLAAGILLQLLTGATAAQWTALVLAALALVIAVPARLWLQRRETEGVEALKGIRNATQCWIMGPGGLRIRYRSQTYKVPWKDIATVGFQKGYIYLYLDSLIYLVVPERAFLAETQEKRFIAFLRKHAGPRSKKGR